MDPSVSTNDLSLESSPPQADSLGASLFRRTYYRLKPFLPTRLRWGLRRRRAQRLKSRSAGVWPIKESAGTIPEGWPGWPEGKSFAMVLTHDVESATGVIQLKQLVELERRFGLRGSCNLIPEGSYTVEPRLRHWLRTQGFEVGVHDLHHDGHLYSSEEGFRKKAEKINSYLAEWGAVGFRSGFMLRQLDWLHALDIEYDCSTFDTDPFEPQPDGVDTIFPHCEHSGKGEGSSYVELPYTLPQDSTLFLLLQEQNADTWINKLDWIAERGGLALINIHPDYIDFGDERAPRDSYPASFISDLLEHLTTRYRDKFWNPTASELARWYRDTQAPNQTPHPATHDSPTS